MQMQTTMMITTSTKPPTAPPTAPPTVAEDLEQRPLVEDQVYPDLHTEQLELLEQVRQSDMQLVHDLLEVKKYPELHLLQ